MDKQLLQEFLKACGGKENLRFEISRPDKDEKESVLLSQSFVLIGRGPRVDLALEDSRVNLRHAYFQLIGGRLFCLDLLSKSGTHWEKGPRRYGWLAVNDTVRIGPYFVRFLGPDLGLKLPGDDTAYPFIPSPQDPVLPDVTLEVFKASGRGTWMRLNHPLALIGRSRFCQLRLTSDKASPLICSFVLTLTGLWVVDLLSKEGTRVNGATVHLARLHDGDQLQFGSLVMRVCIVGDPGRSLTTTGPGATRAEEPKLRQLTAAFSPGNPLFELPSPLSSSGLIPPVMPQSLALDESSGSEMTKAVEMMMTPMVDQLNRMQYMMFEQFHQVMLNFFQMFGTMQKDQMGLIREELERLREVSREIQNVQVGLAKQPAAVEVPLKKSEEKIADAKIIAKPPNTTPKEPPRPEQAGYKTPEAERPATAEPDEVHAWLHQRMAALQNERQNGWQRILKILGL